MSIKSFDKTRIPMLLVVMFLLTSQRAKADFTFGKPENLGPEINSASLDGTPCISRDGMELYFTSTRSGGYGDYDLWLATRSTFDEEWSNPINLGPSINSTIKECFPCLTPDGLTMYFSDYYFDPVRSGGIGGPDLWMCTRTSCIDPWSAPINAGSSVNTSAADVTPTISGDGLTLVFVSNRAGGSGRADIWMSNRPSVQDPWDPATPIDSNVNTTYFDGEPAISADGLTLFLTSDRGSGFGGWDLWMATRRHRKDSWGQAVNLGPVVNTSADESTPFLSPDMKTLYFGSTRTGGFGNLDIWSTSITPIVDFNGDGIVDVKDIVIMTKHWGENYSLCDIGPTPFGDGIIDVEDLKILAEHLPEEVYDPTLVAHWALDETEGMFVTDSAGNNDGYALGDPVWLPNDGQVNGALQMDGVDDYIVTGAAPNPTKGAFSFFIWIKDGAPGQTVLSQMGAANWLCTDQSVGTLMTELTTNGRGASSLGSDVTITDGSWHRVGFVWDGLYRTLYVDGVVVAEDTQDGLDISSNSLYIGTGNAMAPGTYFSGLIDDIRIYNRVISP